MTLALDRPTRPTTPALPPLAGAGTRVPLVTGAWVTYANLDLAASAPALQAVADHVTEVLPLLSSVHRGAGYPSQVSTALLERARECVGEFVGARPATGPDGAGGGGDVVVFTRNTTDALNLLARAVPGPVLCLDVEHHANLLPWRAGTHRTLTAAPTVAQTLHDLAEALRATPTALLTVTGASNVTGEVLPLARIAAIAHAAGARVAVDAAQLAPHRRIDLAASGVDYVALSGHKLYAPYGAGALVGRRDWLDTAAPYLAGGGAVARVGREDVTWAPAPHRHEGGTPNVLGVAALAQACRTLAPVLGHDGDGPAHERLLLDRLATGLATVPGVTPLRIWSDSTDRVAVQSFTVADHPAGSVAAYLSAEHGIGVRDGRFCAHPLLARLCRTGAGAKADGPDGDDTAVRASIGLGTTVEHVDRLVGALHRLVRRGPAWTYAPVGGRWTPSPDPRDLDPFGVGAPGSPDTGCGTRV